MQGAASTRHPTVFPADAALAHLHMNGYGIEDSLQKLADPNGAQPADTASLDMWTAEEIQKFEEGVVRFGKDFTKIFKFMGRRRPIPNIVLFYYVRWKKSPNYKVPLTTI